MSNKNKSDDDVALILIDPPVGLHSPVDEIMAWIAELREMPDLAEVRLAIDQAEDWLKNKHTD